MELKIARWESKGLRCPDGIVNLKKDGFKRFNFIQILQMSLFLKQMWSAILKK